MQEEKQETKEEKQARIKAWFKERCKVKTAQVKYLKKKGKPVSKVIRELFLEGRLITDPSVERAITGKMGPLYF